MCLNKSDDARSGLDAGSGRSSISQSSLISSRVTFAKSRQRLDFHMVRSLHISLASLTSISLFMEARRYHQKYRLQGHKDLCKSLGLDSKKLQTSHLAARLNGYLVGVGGRRQFDQEVEKLGLTEKQAEYVRNELERNEGGGLAC
ncbi:hypothetical protein EVAR_33666_1 [Eumeta japonica]|uniref:Selenoprotein methionine sulfoxide reductase A helical domain-containing protein n=1 Tax=Eumeta variegata TaxID=151549 RepID=A0A4C1VN41_EUMVA|nr:hypothetical protein EVAR_33666_1 [Eumeta japonica]